MKKFNLFSNSKHNLKFLIIALVLLIISLITVTYCWIEGSTQIQILNKDGVNITVKDTSDQKTVMLDGESGDAINLSNYIDNIGNLYFQPAKLEDNKIKIQDGDSFRDATTNDIGNSYIEFDLKLQRPNTDPLALKITEGSSITIDGDNNNPIKMAFLLDGKKVAEYSSDFSNKEAFTLSDTAVHKLKVVIWYDADSASDDYIGKSVNFDFSLGSEITTYNVTVNDVPHAKVTATYTTSSGTEIVINEGDTAQVPANKVITLKAETADGITKSDLNGHKFESFTVQSSTTTTYRTNNQKITVNHDLIISTTTAPLDFYIGGSQLFGFTDWDTNAKMTYNSSDNSVSYVLENAATSNIDIKIVESSFDNRDNSKYSVTLNEPTVTKSSSTITSAALSGTGTNRVLRLSTSSTFLKITVKYILNTNTISVSAVTQSTKTVYLRNSTNWSSPYAHFWVNNTGDETKWPGIPMTKVSGTNLVWSVSVPTRYNKVIFSNNGSNESKSSEFTPDSSHIYDNGVKKYRAYNATSKTIKINVGVISYIYNESTTNRSYYKLHHWITSVNNGDASCTYLGTTKPKSVGSSYWSNAAQTFYMYEASIPVDSTGFKFRIENTDRWFGGDGDALTEDTVYAFEYGREDKALYE